MESLETDKKCSRFATVAAYAPKPVHKTDYLSQQPCVIDRRTQRSYKDASTGQRVQVSLQTVRNRLHDRIYKFACYMLFSYSQLVIDVKESTGQDNIGGRLRSNGHMPCFLTTCFLATTHHNRYGRGSVTVSGCVTVIGRTDFHICQGSVSGVYYRNNIIEPWDIAINHG